MDFELVFKALGEATRIKIIKLLFHKPMYVCELESILQMSQPRISQHLKTLKTAGLLDMEKEGQRVIYFLNRSVMNSIFSDFLVFLDKPLDQLSDYTQVHERMKLAAEDEDINICKFNYK
ncbi:regulatory protein, ArsR [Alkaliphilus metalliredigens QYMF]|uniref:Regulatory protein, ArsR n=1 Tax=Alkaliphilus metalliredigens (strain QYMF) TaxID=293826 RepID=A6TPQ8_ALKMQ|nr:metalloregulator ArsR/SmtB family transcription factor [Alkaliphilus metalliredigens]ABR48176.1 regulatory protein, ArsR [Alkaliphilus metalliredigens QYMF]